MRVVTTDRIRHGLGDWTAFTRIINTRLQLASTNNTMLILEHRASAIHAPAIGLMQLEFVAAMHARCVVTHRYLIIFQVTSPRAACACILRSVTGGAARLGSDTENTTEDILEQGFKRRDGGGDEAYIELGADP
jgi:hypothetical protein